MKLRFMFCRLCFLLLLFVLAGCSEEAPSPEKDVGHGEEVATQKEAQKTHDSVESSGTEPLPRTERETPDRQEGASSVERVFLVEDHSQALPVWSRIGVKNATVLHIDAHHDLLPAPAAKQLREVLRLIETEDFSSLEKKGLYYPPLGQALYGINNYLNLSVKLGLVDKVYWAVPVRTSPTKEELSGFRDYLIEGALPLHRTQFEQLKIEGNHLKGVLGGVDVTIGSLADFKRNPDVPLLLDIDLDFFPPLYDNVIDESYLEIMGRFTRFLEDKNLCGHPTLIAYSHNGGHLPVSLRYLGPWLNQLMLDPQMLDVDPPRNWQLKTEATRQEFFLQYQNAIDLYNELLSNDPDNADAYFSLGMNLLAQGHISDSVEKMTKAYKTDPVYLLGFITAADFLLSKEEPELALKYLEAGESLNPKDLQLLDALGNAYHNLGDYEKAINRYLQVASSGYAAPMTYAYLGDSYFLFDRHDKALDAYQNAISIWKGKSDSFLDMAYWVRLGELEMDKGSSSSACDTFREFRQLFPKAPDDLKLKVDKYLSEPGCAEP